MTLLELVSREAYMAVDSSKWTRKGLETIELKHLPNEAIEHPDKTQCPSHGRITP
jgi:hypothetical protein